MLKDISVSNQWSSVSSSAYKDLIYEARMAGRCVMAMSDDYTRSEQEEWVIGSVLYAFYESAYGERIVKARKATLAELTPRDGSYPF